MQQPKSLRRNTATSSKSSQSSAGASALIRSLDGIGDGDFVASITASNDIDAGAAEDRIARASPTMSDIVLQYRMHYPDDAFLRLWTGLILAQRGRTALAASEFKTSITRGCRHPRIYRYFARCAQDAGAPAIARHALGVIGEGGFYKMSEANDSKGE
jgi:predicted Zn-dependent protease